MTVVNIIGTPKDRVLEELILAQLSKSYRVTYIKSKSLVQAGHGYEIVVADFAELKSLHAPECIIVLKNGGIVPEIPLPEKTIMIANSENIDQLIALRNVGCTVITCGVSEKDTLSCTSVSSDGIVASLNREIIAFSGRAILPLEIPVSSSCRDCYYPLAFTALRLILDDFNSDLGKLM
jgi:hypothetical protein